MSELCRIQPLNSNIMWWDIHKKGLDSITILSNVWHTTRVTHLKAKSLPLEICLFHLLEFLWFSPFSDHSLIYFELRVPSVSVNMARMAADAPLGREGSLH